MPAQPQKPAVVPVDPDGIPDLLKQTQRWLGWSWSWSGRKWDKPPLRIRGGPGSSTDPAAWCPFDEALLAHQSGFVDGLGFALGKDESSSLVFSGLDIDDCIVNGTLDPGAVYLAACLDSYTERSPSQNGIKIFTLGELVCDGKKVDHDRGVEFYGGGRYFTVTGLRLLNFPADVRERGWELSELRTELFPTKIGNGTRLSDREIAQSALGGLNPRRAAGYDDWLRVGMALRSVSEDLLPAWELWSQACPDKYAAGVCASKWRGFHNGPIGIGSLIHWAKEDGWQFPGPSNTTSQGSSAAQLQSSNDDNHMGDGLTDEDGAGPWQLRMELGNPNRYWLKAPMWESSPLLEDGYIRLNKKQLHNWREIRQEALDQAGVWCRPDSPKRPIWDGRKGPQLLRRLIQGLHKTSASADFDRILAAAEFILETGRRAGGIREGGELHHIARLDDGSILFHARSMAARAKHDCPGMSWEDIRDAATKYAEECRPEIAGKRPRLHRLTEEHIAALDLALSRKTPDSRTSAPTANGSVVRGVVNPTQDCDSS